MRVWRSAESCAISVWIIRSKRARDGDSNHHLSRVADFQTRAASEKQGSTQGRRARVDGRASIGKLGVYFAALPVPEHALYRRRGIARSTRTGARPSPVPATGVGEWVTRAMISRATPFKYRTRQAGPVERPV